MSSIKNFLGLCLMSAFAGLILGVFVEVNAMDMQVLPDRDGEGYVLKMTGDVDLGDADKMREKITGVDIDQIYLESNGGYVYEGLKMANIIRDMNIPTFVIDYCHSACTFMFAAGNRSFMGVSAKVGIHNPYYYYLGVWFDVSVNTPLYWTLYKSFVTYFRGDTRMAHAWVDQTFDTDSEDLFIIDGTNARHYGVEYLPLFKK